jgi:hypothetical protein
MSGATERRRAEEDNCGARDSQLAENTGELDAGLLSLHGLGH